MPVNGTLIDISLLLQFLYITTVTVGPGYTTLKKISFKCILLQLRLKKTFVCHNLILIHVDFSL